MPSVHELLVVVCVAIMVGFFFGVLGVVPICACGGFRCGVCVLCALPGAGITAANSAFVACPSRSLSVGLAGCFPFAAW
jgi:hypothetical protein